MELIVGCRNKSELKLVESFLEDFEKIDVNYDISQLAITLLKRYRLSHGLLIADSLIAATAITLDSLFLTKNQKHYKYIRELKKYS